MPRESAPFEVLGRRADSTLLASLCELRLLRLQSTLARGDVSIGASQARARLEVLTLWLIRAGRLASLAGAISETTELLLVRASAMNGGNAGRGRLDMLDCGGEEAVASAEDIDDEMASIH